MRYEIRKADKRVRMSITVPGSLKRRMAQVKGINWSAVASNAFEDVIQKQRK